MTRPAPWDHAANCAAVPASYAEDMGFTPRQWASIQARSLTTVTEDMVERAAEAVYLRCFLHWNSWATEARAKASLEAAKAGYIGGWKAACADARAALNAALNPGEEA